MFKTLFTNKNRKLYKVVYKTGYSHYSDKYTLLITGRSPTDAVENFYRQARDKVSDILEFTEITYSGGVKKEVAGF